MSSWTAVGKFAHNLPKGKHHIHGRLYNTETISEDDLKDLNAKGTPHVKELPKGKAEEAPPK